MKPPEQTPELNNSLDTEPSYITIGGKRITMGGDRIVLRKHPPSASTAFQQTAVDETTDAPSVVSSASWTGMKDVAQKAKSVQFMIPAAISAIEALIAHYDVLGGNGGPELDERLELLGVLRNLHGALGELLDAAAREGWSRHCEGLIADAAVLIGRVKRATASDPLPFAVAGLIEVIGWVLGVPGGGVLSTMALEGRKK